MYLIKNEREREKERERDLAYMLIFVRVIGFYFLLVFLVRNFFELILDFETCTITSVYHSRRCVSSPCIFIQHLVVVITSRLCLWLPVPFRIRVIPPYLCLTGIDTRIRFSLEPLPGDSAFDQWKDAMRAVARLPHGIPDSFRKKVRVCIDWECVY